MAARKRTTIISNGGGQVLPLKALFARLAENTLDPSFEDCGNFVDDCPIGMDGKPLLAPGVVEFWGNFFDYSHVFRIQTSDRALIKRLTAAIRENQSRASYAQAKADQLRAAAEHEAQRRARDRERNETRRHQARVTLGMEAA